MADSLHDLSTARTPRQSRAQVRFDGVLDAASTLLLESGFAGFSIPELALRLGYTRASIYNFFPTANAVLNELAKRELAALESQLATEMHDQAALDWPLRVRRTMAEVVRFYEARPLARRLVLGASLNHEGYRAVAMTIQSLGRQGRLSLQSAGIDLPETPVDVMALAVDLGTTCLRHSVFLHDRILPEFEQQAVLAMQAYLQPYVDRALERRG
jgi:AcrR family transcriptional regulator